MPGKTKRKSKLPSAHQVPSVGDPNVVPNPHRRPPPKGGKPRKPTKPPAKPAAKRKATRR
jgi:hypothetical protein